MGLCFWVYIVWCLFDLWTMGTFDVTEISGCLVLQLPVWFPIGIILLTIGMFSK
jgi:hypothetical protein